MADMTEGRRRVVIEGVEPEIDGGRFPIKRVVGETVVVEADVFADGHELLDCLLLCRREQDADWRELPMVPLGNDRWLGEFEVTEVGRYRYTIEGWVNRFRTWRADLAKRLEAGQDVSVDLLIGADLVADAAGRASGADRDRLSGHARTLREAAAAGGRGGFELDAGLEELMLRHPDRRLSTRYEPELAVVVDRERARFSAWYELFPRSYGPDGRHGTFRDCEAQLPYVASLGFDVLYLPPIHPIGRSHRKGRNNATTATPADVGSPWAIGGPEGGHTAIHPDLGTLADFRRFLAKAREHGLEVALDIAFQCSPDHPWVREHPEWFRARPDGRIQYAENPPKKYQDIYPLDFETPAWRELWDALKGVLLYWVDQGVRIFRVDNPHTKAFGFWEWAVTEVKAAHPDVLFLSEAFTRPRVMYRLAKLGFSQSYTYFTWRNTKAELADYFTELTRTSVWEYFRPSLWPNTPDILPEFLQLGGRPAFAIRAVLAATLAASYGIYGPAFELAVNAPREPGSEEYLYSEKYELKRWDLAAPDSLADLLARVNRARRENPALQQDRSLRFHETDNPMLLCYSKTTPDLANTLLVVVNLDPFQQQAGWIDVDLAALGIPDDQAYELVDLLGGTRHLWQGPRGYVDLAPAVAPAHLFRVQRRVRTERDFDYFA